MKTHTHSPPRIHPTHQPRRGKGERGEGERPLTVMECPRPHLLKSPVNLNHWHTAFEIPKPTHTDREGEENGDLLHIFDIHADWYI